MGSPVKCVDEDFFSKDEFLISFLAISTILIFS